MTMKSGDLSPASEHPPARTELTFGLVNYTHDPPPHSS